MSDTRGNPSSPRPGRFRSFRSKLLLCFVLCTAVPLLLVGGLSYATSYSIAKNKVMDSVFLTGRQVALTIDTRLQQIEHVADSIQFYMYTFESTPSYPRSEYLRVAEQVKSSVSSLGRAFSALHINLFLDAEHFYSQERYSVFSLEDLEDHGLDRTQQKAMGASSYWQFAPARSYPYEISAEPVPSVVCYRVKWDMRGNLPEYAYAISLDCAEFAEALGDVYADSGITGYLVDVATGAVIAASDGAAEPLDDGVWAALREGSRSFRLPDHEYLAHTTRNPDWLIVTRVAGSHIREGTGVLVNIILIALLSTLTVTVIATVFISRTSTRRLNRLTGIIASTGPSRDEEHLQALRRSFPDAKKNQDEIDILAHEFCAMLGTIQDNFDQLLEMSINEEKLKYQLLQSQINPHFLYNILQSIQTCQSGGRIDSANRMTGSLARFYRHILRKQDDLIPLREEIEIALLYLEMESFCHNNNLAWQIHLEDGTEHFLICKFTLQPIVENCIVHGIRSSNHRMTVSIDASYHEDELLIRVRDDGCGIPAEKLAELRELLHSRRASDGEHYGLGNVAARLANIRPDYGRMEIDSTEGEGTEVRIYVQQIL